MATEQQSEKSPLIGSPVSSPELDQVSMDEPARNKLDSDPNILTSFDDKEDGSPLEKVHQHRQQTKWAGLTVTLVLSVLAGVLGSSTQFGYNTGVINNPKQEIRDSFANNSFSEPAMTVAVSIYAIGGMIGALAAGIVADWIGRKYAMLLNNTVIIAGVIFESFAFHPAMFIIGRILVGINSGINTVIVPMYISEISPVNLRGSMGVCHQMAVVSTILFSQILGIRTILGRPDSEFFGWRILFALTLIFSAFQLALLPWLPQSPKYLFVKCKKVEAAIHALKRLRGNADINQELQLMRDELKELERPRTKVTLIQFFKIPHLFRALCISIMLHLSQQLSGINGLLYYSNNIFQAAGLSAHDAGIATVVCVGVVLVIVTFITVFLVEFLGRRTLMLYGLGGMTISFTILTSMFCFQDGLYGNLNSDEEAVHPATVPAVLLVMSSLGTVAFFALGPGGIPWLMVSELFMQEARPIAVTIATIVNWMANFAVGFFFPFILEYMYPYGTIIFTVICGALWTYLYFFLPETKGRSVEDITAELKAKTGERKAVRQGVNEPEEANGTNSYESPPPGKG